MQHPPHAGRSRWPARLLAVALGCALLAGLELALRSAGYPHDPFAVRMVLWSEESDERLAAGDDLHRFHPPTIWSPRPGARDPWTPAARISSQGFRGADPDPAATLRVLVLGDSSTFGMGVPADKTYAAVLERKLAAHLRTASEEGAPEPRVQVLNAGIIASTLTQGLARYREVRATWKPHLVVAAYGVVNEQWPAIDGTDAEKIERLTRPPSLARALRERLRLAQLLAAWTAPDPAADAAAVAPTLEEMARDPNYVRRTSTTEFDACLTALEREVRADGGQLVLLRMPRRAGTERTLPRMRDYDPVLADFAERSGCPLVDGYADFRLAGTENLLFCDGFHPSVFGHSLLTSTLTPVLYPLADRVADPAAD